MNQVIDIKAIASGDVKAFEVLYLAYYNKVLTYTTSLLHNSVKAEDATQDVFLKIWRNRHNLVEGENVNSYIYMTARRVVLDVYRDEKYAQRHKEWAESNRPEESVEVSCVNEIEDIAAKMIECMPPKRKEVFKLSRINGLTAKEIADKMDLSIHTVNKHIALALSSLKKKLNDYLTILVFKMEEYNKILWDRIENVNSPAEKKKAKAAFQAFLQMVGIRDEQSGDFRRIYRAGFLWAALSMPLGFMVAWLIFGTDESATWQEVSTRPGESTQIVLSDNTQVTLNGGSTIVYPSSFNDECRQIYFSGEGYFEVQADSRHPFDIITNDARIKVHGTRFNLKSYSEDNMLSVALDEGSVQFSGNSGVVVDMVPGDNLSYDKETGTLRKEFSQESSGLWRKGQYYFKKVTLHDIARDIERLFGVRVLIENESLLHSHYHIALVNGETVDDFIRILSLDNSLKVSRSGNTIIIK